MRLNRAIIAVLASVALVTGCSDGGAEEPPGTSAPNPGAPPDGDAVVIEPLDSVPGAERVEFQGVGIDVPAGMVTDTSTGADGTEVLAIRPEGAQRAAVTVTVTPQPGADAAVVDVSSAQTEAELAVSPAVADMTRRSVEWDGVPYAVMTTLDLTVDEESEAVHRIALVTMHDPASTMVVGVSAEAPEAELEGSDAWAALRTFRFDG